MEKSNPILEVTNLVTEFKTEEGTVRAVDNISFRLKAGETLGIVGESGSGKSVTSLSIMRLIQTPPGKITHGEILYDNYGKKINLLHISEKQMQKIRGNDIAMIFQEPMTSLNPVYTCGQQVMEAILQHRKFPEVSKIKNLFELTIKSLLFILPFIFLIGIWFTTVSGAVSSIVSVLSLSFALIGLDKFYLTSKQKIARDITIDLFKQTELPSPERIFKSYPHQLSGGQKQRVMIAMAMSCNPKILIADEPTTALDVTIQKTILDLMKKLQQTHNMGIIFITHDLGVIADLADKVFVMYKGKIVETGTTIDILKHPVHPYTKGLLA